MYRTKKINVVNSSLVNINSIDLSDHSYSLRAKVTIGCLNVRGLKSKLVSHEFNDMLANYDFLCVSETKLEV